MPALRGPVCDHRSVGDDVDLRLEADLTAVVAHSLLNSMSVVMGTIELLQTHGEVLEPGQRAQHLARALAQSRHVTGVLQDLVRGLPPEVRQMLDELGGE
jgi:signal transduction histidine kinase